MKKYSIRDIEKLTGISVFTLRAWEKRYCITSPERTSTNIRFYCHNDLKRILNISLLINNGHKISKIACLDNEMLCELVLEAGKNKNDDNIYITGLIDAMISVDEEKFNSVFEESVQHSGFENTMIHVVYPFLQKIGILWQTGNTNPAQEHFAEHLVREKLIAASYSLEKPKKFKGTFLLFLPVHETHETGLLFYNYLLRKKGYRVIYLGAAVAFEDMVITEKTRPADYLLTFFESTVTDVVLQQYVYQLKKTFPGKTVFISGNCFLNASEVKLPKLFHKISCAGSFSDLLKKL